MTGQGEEGGLTVTRRDEADGSGMARSYAEITRSTRSSYAGHPVSATSTARLGLSLTVTRVTAAKPATKPATPLMNATNRPQTPFPCIPTRARAVASSPVRLSRLAASVNILTTR